MNILGNLEEYRLFKLKEHEPLNIFKIKPLNYYANEHECDLYWSIIDEIEEYTALKIISIDRYHFFGRNEYFDVRNFRINDTLTNLCVLRKIIFDNSKINENVIKYYDIIHINDLQNAICLYKKVLNNFKPIIEEYDIIPYIDDLHDYYGNLPVKNNNNGNLLNIIFTFSFISFVSFLKNSLLK